MLNFDQEEELRERQKSLDKAIKELEDLKLNFESQKLEAIMKAERPLKNEITSLESELRIQRQKFNTLQNQYELSLKSEELGEIMEKLSTMFLSKSTDSNFLNPEQQKLIKGLFSDLATRQYKNEIKRLKKVNKVLKSKSIDKGNYISTNLINLMLSF